MVVAGLIFLYLALDAYTDKLYKVTGVGVKVNILKRAFSFLILLLCFVGLVVNAFTDSNGYQAKYQIRLFAGDPANGYTYGYSGFSRAL